LKALYSLSIAFYGFTKEETQHMKEVTIENGGTPISDMNDEQCTHIVINDQEVKQVPILTLSNDSSDATGGGSLLSNSINGQKITSSSSIATTSSISTSCTNNTNQLTPTLKSNPTTTFNPSSSPFSNTRASIVRAEWFWASIQICCRASECLYEFTKPKAENTTKTHIDPPTKRIKLSVDNLLSHETLNGCSNNHTNNNNNNTSCADSPHNQRQQQHSNQTPTNHSNARVSNSHISNTSITNNNNNNNNNHLKNSSNNLLTSVLSSVGLCNSNNNNNGNNANLDCDSPTLTNHMNGRLSSGLYGNMNRNNISNNNLSTSASLLDATADDVMSSMFKKYYFS
jgi:hypothetical protein